MILSKKPRRLPPAGGKSSEIIFAWGVYLGENTSQSASVEFVRFQRTNYARSRLQAFYPQRACPLGIKRKARPKPCFSG